MSELLSEHTLFGIYNSSVTFVNYIVSKFKGISQTN